MTPRQTSDSKSTGAPLYLLVPAAFLVLLFIVLTPRVIFSQRTDLFDVKRITNDVKSRFNLSSKDVKAIQPMIDSETKKAVKIYARFSGDAPEYSARLWRQVIEDRLNFEAGLSASLTPKQTQAIRSARSRMEKRVVDYLVYDYVSFLAQILELSEFEFNDVNDILESESDAKRDAITQHLKNPAKMQTEIEKISDQTDSKLRKILDSDQWRHYLELTRSFDLVA